MPGRNPSARTVHISDPTCPPATPHSCPLATISAVTAVLRCGCSRFHYHVGDLHIAFIEVERRRVIARTVRDIFLRCLAPSVAFLASIPTRFWYAESAATPNATRAALRTEDHTSDVM